MVEVTVRELRNHGGEVLDRVVAGERVIVTRSGRPVAELSPVHPTALEAATLLQRWRHVPPVDPARLRADIDDVVDQAL